MAFVQLPEPRFKQGDKVHVRGARPTTIWTVLRLDTNNNDREHAYKIQLVDGGRVRYANESVLEPALSTA